MFGAPEIKTEWLPEIPQNIEPVRPAPLQVEVGDTALEKWPLYDPIKTAYSSWGNAQWAQIGLGNFQKTIDLGNGIKLELVKVPAWVANGIRMKCLRQLQRLTSHSGLVVLRLQMNSIGHSILNMTAETNTGMVTSSDDVDIP